MMNKSDYDKYYKKGGTYVIPIEAFNELFDELERLSFNYEQALDDLDKKDNIINKIDKYANKLRYYADEDDKEYVISKDIHNIIQELKGSNEPSFEEMVGFVENVCKDIKSQPTLHEELEEERKTIAEEIADVMVMLKKFQYFYEITDKDIEDIMKQKISRQLERIENEIKNIGLN